MSSLFCKHDYSVGWDSSAPQLVLAFLVDSWILFTTLIDLLKIIIYLSGKALFLLVTFVAVIISNCIYYTTWISLQFVRGILGLDDKSTSALCWLVVIFALVSFGEPRTNDLASFLNRAILSLKHHIRLLRRPMKGLSILRRLSLRQSATVQVHNNTVAMENQRNEEAEVEPINRQFEAQNFLNENEENILVEADQRRILYENRHNVALEYGADHQRASLENQRNVQRENNNHTGSVGNQQNQNQQRHYFFLRRRQAFQVNSIQR